MLNPPLPAAAELSTLLPALAPWQALLTVAPALVMALAAWWAPRGTVAAAWRTAAAASGLALALALAGLLGLAAAGSGQGLGLRSDGVGALVLLLVSFIGWAVLRHARQSLRHEAGEAGAVRWLLATVAAVLLVVASNHLLLLAVAWMATSLALHRLLLFYPQRPAAVLAAHKKFVLGRLADGAMLAACALLAWQFHTLRIDALLAQAAALPALPAAVQAAVLLVVLAALLKCAQLPFHGWLIQVMEAPTPVSALLHAGVVNLGGLVLVRLAPLVADVPAASALLVAAGAATAVLAALVATTRISIKVALAWSTCAQMGFMLLQCGLGLWEMALLHLVAHALYKAHAFLGAGGVVRQTLVRALAPAPAPPSVAALLATAGAALALTAALAWAFGLHQGTSPTLWVMAGIVALALVPLLHPGSMPGAAAQWPRRVAAAAALACVYLLLHQGLQGWVVPAGAVPAAPWWPLAALLFAALFGLQCAIAARPGGPLAGALYPWFYGGLYLDERFSRQLLRLWPAPRPRP